MYINYAFAWVVLNRHVLPWPSSRRKQPELLLLWGGGYALFHQNTSSFALSYRMAVSVRRWQWPVKLTRTNGVTWEWNRFFWAFKSLPPWHGCMKSSGCLIDGCRLSSLTPSAYILTAYCTADTGSPCPSHFGEFESQSSVIHFGVLPGNSEEKKNLPNIICLLNERMNGLLN